MKFQDHFSGHAAAYAKSRPEYPRAIFEWLATIAPGTRLAVDCATGNGQAARGLAEFFETVHAFDASAEQISNGHAPANVVFGVSAAESTPLSSGEVDLVTVAQALHWLDHPRFFAEVKRILRPGGVLVAWGYGRFIADEPILSFSRERIWKQLESYWPPERKLVETAYATLDFPFEEIPAPPFAIELEWTLGDLVDYVRTWSASKKYLQQTQGSAIDDFQRDLAPLWPDGERRPITMPLFVRAGRSASGR